MKTALEILRKNNLRVTDCRIEVLNHFIATKRAVSHQELEAMLEPQFDRVTLYRTLHTYLEKDIIHQIPDSGYGAKYALCEHDHGPVNDHNHVHFKCDKCQSIQCLLDIHINPIILPDGFKAHTWNYIIQGLCNQCSKK